MCKSIFEDKLDIHTQSRPNIKERETPIINDKASGIQIHQFFPTVFCALLPLAGVNVGLYCRHFHMKFRWWEIIGYLEVAQKLLLTQLANFSVLPSLVSLTHKIQDLLIAI